MLSRTINENRLPSRTRIIANSNIQKISNFKQHNEYMSSSKNDPIFIASTPPNEFMENLKKRIGVYFLDSNE